MTSGEWLGTLNEPRKVAIAAFSPEGKILATGGFGGSIGLWSLSGDLISVIRGYHGSITSLEFSKNSLRLLSGSADRTLRTWEVARGVEQLQLEHPGSVREARWSDDGESLLSVTNNPLRPWRWPANFHALASARRSRTFTSRDIEEYHLGDEVERGKRSWRVGLQSLRVEAEKIPRMVERANLDERDALELAKFVGKLRHYARRIPDDESVKAILRSEHEELLAEARLALSMYRGDEPKLLVGIARLEEKLGELTSALPLVERARAASAEERGLDQVLAEIRAAVAPDLPTYATIVSSLTQRVRLVPLGVKWQFLREREDAAPEWTRESFDDSSWESGVSPFGYDSREGETFGTLLPDMRSEYVSGYFRHAFSVDVPDRYELFAIDGSGRRWLRSIPQWRGERTIQRAGRSRCRRRKRAVAASVPSPQACRRRKRAGASSRALAARSGRDRHRIEPASGWRECAGDRR